MPREGFETITVKETTYSKIGKLAGEHNVSRAKMVDLLLDKFELSKELA